MTTMTITEMIEMYEPTLHKPVPMGADVIIPAGPYSDRVRKGKVAGISFIHAIFNYIIILDPGDEYQSEYGVQNAVSIPGPTLEKPGGGSWRLDS